MMRSTDQRWNIADLFEAITEQRGHATMIVEGDRSLTWTDVDRRANAVASHLLAAGLSHGDRVGLCSRNTAAHLEAYIACCKASLVPFNINFRYGVEEMTYLLDNADARALVFHREFGSVLADAHRRCGSSIEPVQIADSSDAAGWPNAADYETAASADATAPVVERSSSDLVFQYTGGTTGMPKAVMWRQGDLIELLAGSDAPPGTDETQTSRIIDKLDDEPRRSCSAAPFIHGTGLLSQMANFFTGGASVILGGNKFDPVEAWRTIERHAVNVLVIVGDPFARPLLDALDSDPGAYDLSSLQMITSSGAMFSRPVKEGLIGHVPHLAVLDAFGSSEANGLGRSLATAEDLDETAAFQAGEDIRVLADDGTFVEPGDRTPGRIAVCGLIPVGYHKDPDKTAETYPVIDGVRYSVPGDYVRLHADKSMTLLGRGSSVINTGGEKVYPEEVEERLKEHASVFDAACIGVEDERFGQAVCAVVQPQAGAVIDEHELHRHLRTRLAGYKVPRHFVAVDDLHRHPNGKLDRRAVASTVGDAITVRRAADSVAP
ncbi:MAG: AMP-binding protein [Xanthomonadales bacterium]|nr:AMP-binding protein [Xanthomonadales bacterium]